MISSSLRSAAAASSTLPPLESTRVRLRDSPRGVAPLPELGLDVWPVLAEGFLSVRGLRGEPKGFPFGVDTRKLLRTTRPLARMAEKRIALTAGRVPVGEDHQTLLGVLADR